MPLFLSSLLLSAAVVGAATSADPFALPEEYHRLAPRTKGFSWKQCGSQARPRECSRFEVPLDWHNAAAGKASLAVARYRALREPKFGTLFVNPGGPGSSGVNYILGSTSNKIMMAAGEHYDIVSWDPRGVGDTVPRAECFETRAEERKFWQGTIPSVGIEARGNFTDQRDLDEFYSQVDEVDTLLKEYGQRCIAYSPDTFQYIGSAAAVRDMIAMHDLLEGKDKPVNYYGLSYGTIIGSYFINMFPDRVGRVVLDGVSDPVYWANRPSYQKWAIKPESTDEAFAGFAAACAAAGPSGCAIASEGSTAASITQWTRDLIDAAYDHKRKFGRSAKISSATIRSRLYRGMYGPTSWPQLAKDIASWAKLIANASSTTSIGSTRALPEPLFEIESRQTGTSNETNNAVANDPPDAAFEGVTCADAVDAGGVTTKVVFDSWVNVTRTVSQMFGPIFSDGGIYCHHWPVRAVERFTGPWNKKLGNTILVIGNEADPVTPFMNAKKVADALGDSAILIEQDDYGHVSFAMRSNCTIAALQEYFLYNTLPKQDKFCGTNQVLFPGRGVTKSTLDSLGSSKTLSSTSNNSNNVLKDELEIALERSRKLFIAVVALGSACGLLFLSILFSCCLQSRKSAPAHAAYIHRGAFEKAIAGEEQRHTYDNPYAPSGGSKGGGYSRVQS